MGSTREKPMRKQRKRSTSVETTKFEKEGLESMAVEWDDWDTEGPDSKSGGETAGGVDARERHKLAERERRKSMRELFLSLHALLPHASTVRKEQSAVLDEVIKYIPVAVARLRSLQNQKDSPSPVPSKATPAVQVSDRTSASSDSTDCDIRVAPEPSSSVVIRIRGDRVNLSLIDANPKGTSQSLLLSTVLDELEAHHLEVIRVTNCRDGSKLLHHSESKVCDGLDRSPALLKAKLQELACKLQKLRKSSSLKRSFDQLD